MEFPHAKPCYNPYGPPVPQAGRIFAIILLGVPFFPILMPVYLVKCYQEKKTERSLRSLEKLRTSISRRKSITFEPPTEQLPSVETSKSEENSGRQVIYRLSTKTLTFEHPTKQVPSAEKNSLAYPERQILFLSTEYLAYHPRAASRRSTSCPLFSKCPFEIREQIWLYVIGGLTVTLFRDPKSRHLIRNLTELPFNYEPQSTQTWPPRECREYRSWAQSIQAAQKKEKLLVLPKICKQA